MKLTINGRDREFPKLDSDPKLLHLIELLELKADRVAVERNGDIVPRSNWAQVRLAEGDKLEVVQFVGGGIDAAVGRFRSASSANRPACREC
ncbi:MAG: sulfur carrier protein ThiS [Acidobacteriaceae bacterium]